MILLITFTHLGWVVKTHPCALWLVCSRTEPNVLTVFQPLVVPLLSFGSTFTPGNVLIHKDRRVKQRRCLRSWYWCLLGRTVTFSISREHSPGTHHLPSIPTAFVALQIVLSCRTHGRIIQLLSRHYMAVQLTLYHPPQNMLSSTSSSSCTRLLPHD